MGPVNRRHRTHFYLSAEKPPNYSDRIIKFSYFADTTIIHIFNCTKIIAYETPRRTALTTLLMAAICSALLSCTRGEDWNGPQSRTERRSLEI